jgi:hypothetical protein
MLVEIARAVEIQGIVACDKASRIAQRVADVVRYTPALVRWKIVQVETMLFNERCPASPSAPATAPGEDAWRLLGDSSRTFAPAGGRSCREPTRATTIRPLELRDGNLGVSSWGNGASPSQAGQDAGKGTYFGTHDRLGQQILSLEMLRRLLYRCLKQTCAILGGRGKTGARNHLRRLVSQASERSP